MYYKYRACAQRTWEILINRELYFSLPCNLNDPLDVSIDLNAEYERTKAIIRDSDPNPDGRRSFLLMLLDDHKRISKKTGNEVSLNQAIYEYIQTRGVLSLSMNPHDALLWAHYADGHKGVTLGFNDTLLDIEHTGHGKVTYHASPPYVEKFIELVDEFETFCRPWDGATYSDERGKEFYNKQLDTMFQAGLYSKSEKWKYEEEFRIIAEPGNHPYHPKALAEIILGAKTSPADEKTIKKILDHPDYSHVKLKKVFNPPGTFDFLSRELTEDVSAD